MPEKPFPAFPTLLLLLLFLLQAACPESIRAERLVSIYTTGSASVPEKSGATEALKIPAEPTGWSLPVTAAEPAEPQAAFAAFAPDTTDAPPGSASADSAGVTEPAGPEQGGGSLPLPDREETDQDDQEQDDDDAAAGTGGVFPSLTFWGYVFGDFYAVSEGSGEAWGRSEFSAKSRNDRGIRMRRVYLGLDGEFAPRVSGRVLVEGNAEIHPQDGYQIFFKQLYLQWNPELPLLHGAELQAGLVPTPMTSGAERSWGYRPVEMEPLNARDFSTTVDQGVSLSGHLDSRHRTGFTLLAGRGAGRNTQTDSRYELYGSFFIRPLANLSAEFLAMHRERDGGLTRSTFRALLAWETETESIGLLAAQGRRRGEQSGPGGPLVTMPAIYSIYTSFEIAAGPPALWVYSRIDYYDPDRSYDPATIYSDPGTHYTELQMIAGLHLAVTDQLNLMPNLHFNRYQARTEAVPARPSDVVPRLTVFLTF